MRHLLSLLLGAALMPALPAHADAPAAWNAYLDGQYAAARTELARLAESGDAEAQYAMGSLCSDGLAVPRSYSQAAAWFERAAEQGHGAAQFSLGFLYYFGAGEGAGEEAVMPNPVLAARWLAPAAEGGHPMAQHLLARLYAGGKGVAKDEVMALELARAAAEKGLAGAQFDAGLMLGTKPGHVDQRIEAYKWFLLAAQAGHPGAGENLELLSERLNVREIAE